MLNTEALVSSIQEYQLVLPPVRVYPVFWIEEPPEYPSGFMGAKPSAFELQIEVDRLLLETATTIDNESSARQFLRDNRLGIDCSGFVFHVLSRTQQSTGGQALESGLYIPKSSLITSAAKENWREVHELTQQEIDQFDEHVPLSWVCETFKRKAQFLTNVDRLCMNNESSSAVTDLCEVLPGDLICMKRNGRPKHVAVVTAAERGLLECWHSWEVPGELGGVMSFEIQTTNPLAPLKDQHWSIDPSKKYDDYAVRRLKLDSS